ncbi:NADPH:quinone reductase [Actinobacteria bacterium OK074]|nr:NADPH:quinone reductase [Actinobacteria bacterium OK074]
MHAITMSRFGGPDVLQPTEVPVPEAAPAHRLVQVVRAGVNFADLHVRSNSYLGDVSLPYIPGNELVGRLDGQRVVALTRGGGYAQIAAAHRGCIFPAPDDIDDDTALTLTLQGNSAWHLLHTVLDIKSGETVIVPAAAGGVGSLAVQLAKRAGARVVAMASTPGKRRRALELGADAAVDSTSPTLADDLTTASGGGAQAALEMTGGPTLLATVRALAPFSGRMAVFGHAGGVPSDLPTRELMARGVTVTGFWLPLLYARRGALRTSLDDLVQAVRDNELTVPAPTVYPLAQAARAHTEMAARRTTGKVVLDVPA